MLVSAGRKGMRMLPLPQDRVARIERILDEYLGPTEVNLAHDLFKDRSRGIRWGRVVELLADELVEDGYMLLHECPFRKRTDIYKPERGVDPFREVDGLSKTKNKHAEHLAVLEMTLKLLTVIRAAIKQRVKNIPTVSEEELALFQDALGEACVVDDEEVMPAALLPAVVPIAPPPLPAGTQRRVLLKGGAEARQPVARIPLEHAEAEAPTEGSCAAGNHRRVVVLRKLEGDGVVTTKQCKDCGEVLLAALTEKPRSNPVTCPHSKAHWDPEQPGTVALCAECGIEVDPDGFDWNGAGLEEPGDNPDTDEVIELCTES